VKLEKYEGDIATLRSKNEELNAGLAMVNEINRELEATLKSLRNQIYLKKSIEIKVEEKTSSDLEKKNSDLEKKLTKLTESYDEVVRKQGKQIVERQGEVNMPKFDKAEAKKIIEDFVKKVEKSRDHYTKKMESLKTKLENNMVEPQK